MARASLREYQRELAERLRSAEAGRAASKLGIQVGDAGWLVDLGDADEVIPVTPITPVPLAKAWFRGVTNIRGNLFGVVDFGAFLGGAASAIGDTSRLVLIGERFRTGAALLVDRSLGLRNPAQLSPIERPTDAAPWVKARYTDPEGRSWTELDLAQLTQNPDFLAVAA